MTMTPQKPNGTTMQPSAEPPEPHYVTSMTVAETFKFALEPSNFGETIKACELLSEAQIAGCETPALILSKVMAGRALGLSFMQSVMGIDNIKGTLSLRAKTKVALCLQSTLCEYFRCTETTETSCTYATKRVGEPEKSYTFTIEEAYNSKLVDRGDKKDMNNWNRFPAAMLRARASSYLADIVYPDVMKGMASSEEMRDVRVDPNEMVGEVVQQPVAGAPVRDYAAEAQELIARIETITETTTLPQRKPIREAAMAWDGIDPYKKTVIDAYNAAPKFAAPKPAAAASAPATPAAPAPPPAAPAMREPGVD